MKQTLYSGYSNNCCAYCKFHRCFLTVKQLKAKECLKKECWYLTKNEDHTYWRQREMIKQKRKDRKIKLDQYVASFSV